MDMARRKNLVIGIKDPHVGPPQHIVGVRVHCFFGHPVRELHVCGGWGVAEEMKKGRGRNRGERERINRES